MTKVIVYHTLYGCETGCCGHAIEMAGQRAEFDFAHPGYKQDFRSFAEELVRDAFGDEHVADLDWENCVIVDD